MVSNAAQLILKECAERGVDLHHLDEHVVVQINDTHPSLVIPELIRLLQERGFTLDEAIRLVSRTCAYTNHTNLAEALEKWPVSYLEQVVPHLLPIIRELDARVRAKYDDESVYIIDKDQKVHMAHMDIHYGFSVNGVAALHTEILKNSELKNFCRIYPEKFNNKTNGITFRRWLLHCNPRLAELIRELIGDGFERDASELEKLLAYRDDPRVLDRLDEVKRKNKKDLRRYLYETQNLEIDAASIYDVQIKRLHEYKRQQMNALYAIYKYKEIKRGRKPEVPVTMIFGEDPAYTMYKDIIHLILCLQQLDCQDAEVDHLVPGGDGGKLQRDEGLPSDSGGGYIGADFSGLQGSLRYRKYEVHAERRGDPGHRGRRQRRGGAEAGGRRQHLYFRKADGGRAEAV